MKSLSNSFVESCPKCHERSFIIDELCENAKSMLVLYCENCGHVVGKQENNTSGETDNIMTKFEKFLG